MPHTKHLLVEPHLPINFAAADVNPLTLSGKKARADSRRLLLIKGAGNLWLMRNRKRLVAGLCGLALALMLFPTTAPAQQFADNVVIVLDASGSMGQMMRDKRTKKMDAAKSAIKAVMQTVPESTHVGLLVFSASNLKNDWVYPLGPRNDAVMMQALDRIQPGSSTPLGAYIKQGADRLLAERKAQFGYGTYRLLIVTDGEANDKNLVNRYTPEVMARGITMDVIGVAMSQAHTLATRVHSYRRADDPESLKRAIREVFAEVGGTATDVAQAEAFDLLAPIPTEVASAMIQSLSTSGNEPIGSSPPIRNAAVPRPVPAQNRVAPPMQSHGSQSHSPRAKVVWLPILVGLFVVGVIVFIGIIAVVFLIVKANQRRGRR